MGGMYKECCYLQSCQRYKIRVSEEEHEKNIKRVYTYIGMYKKTDKIEGFTMTNQFTWTQTKDMLVYLLPLMLEGKIQPKCKSKNILSCINEWDKQSRRDVDSSILVRYQKWKEDQDGTCNIKHLTEGE